VADFQSAINEFQERLLAQGEAKAASAHHRLPQFYLRGFLGQDNHLRLFDPRTGESRFMGTKKAFAEPGYYTIRIGDNDEPNAMVEELYGALENTAAPVHHRLVGGDSPAELSHEDRINYAAFLAAQITRGETFRELDREIADKMGKTLLEMNLARPKEEWEAIRTEAAAKGAEPPPELTDEVRETLAKGNFTFQHSPEFSIHLSLQAIPDLTYILADFSWHSVHFDEPCLFSNEHPVSYWRPPSPVDRFHGIGPMTANEVRIPLSPSVALVLVHPRFFYPDRRGRGSKRAAATINWWTWIFQRERTLIMSPDVAGHPLPLGDFFTVPFRAEGNSLRDPGAIIDH
jgi:hypothetical protein